MPGRSPLKKRGLLLEPLEPRLVLNGPTVIPLDPTLDQFGDQVITVQAYADSTQETFSIFDSGASAATFSAKDQAVFTSNGTPIPIKVPGGAQANGIGGNITGDVSEPGTILADGIHACTLTFNAQGIPQYSFDLNWANGATPAIQAFVGTDSGSPLLATVTGTPMLEPSTINPTGLAAKIVMQGSQLDFSSVIPGLVTPIPDLHFVLPATQLGAGPGIIGPLRVPMEIYGEDNYLNPGNQVTESPNLVQPDVQLVDNGIAVPQQKFLFDTGSQLSIISTAEAVALGLDLSHPTTSIAIQGVGGDRTVPGFTLDQLDVPLSGGGMLEFTHVPVYVMDIGFGINGLLGMNLFNHANAMLFNPYDSAGPSVELTFNNGGQGVGGSSGLTPSQLSGLGQLGLPFADSFDGQGHHVPGLQPPGPPGGDAPLTSVPSDITATEGVAFDDTVASFTDADPAGKAGDFTASIRWGDGQTSAGTIAANSTGGFNVTASHAYAEEGSYTFIVKIKDVGGSVTTATGTAGVLDAPLSVTTLPVSAVEGRLFVGAVGFFTDMNPGGDLADFSATINWGDGQTSTGVITQVGFSGFRVSGNHAYTEEGSLPITVTVQDVGGSSASGSNTAAVGDAPLFATAINFGAMEGTAFSGKLATFSDLDPNGKVFDYSAIINWADGSSSNGSITADAAGGFDVSGSHVYAEEGYYSFGVTVHDIGGSIGGTGGTATILDPPVMPGSVPPLNFQQGISPGTVMVATFQDQAGSEPVGNYTASINWGDGSLATAGTITQPGGAGTVFEVNGSHTYTTAGHYNLGVTINGSEGDSAATGTTVQVFQPPGIIAMAGPSGQWWGGPSNGSSQFSASLWASWSPAVSWTNLQTGNFTGDGRTDIVGFDPTSGGWWVGVPNGSSFTTTLWTAWSPAVTWVDVRVGDFTGDGKMDIVGRVQQSGQWWMAQSTGSSFVNTLWATWAPNVTWSHVLVGDFTGNGRADIAGYENGHWWVGLSTGSSFTTSLWATWAANINWVDVQAADFTGDGKADITARDSQSGIWWTAVSTGSGFTTTYWGAWSPGVTWVDVRVGDFTGDGKMDIIGRVAQSGQWWLGQSTGSSFTNSLWAVWSPMLTWVDIQVGDFNGDGKDDITGLAAGTGQWWTSLSGGSSSSTTSLWGAWVAGINWHDANAGIFA